MSAARTAAEEALAPTSCGRFLWDKKASIASRSSHASSNCCDVPGNENCNQGFYLPVAISYILPIAPSGSSSSRIGGEDADHQENVIPVTPGALKSLVVLIRLHLDFSSTNVAARQPALYE